MRSRFKQTAEAAARAAATALKSWTKLLQSTQTTTDQDLKWRRLNLQSRQAQEETSRSWSSTSRTTQGAALLLLSNNPMLSRTNASLEAWTILEKSLRTLIDQLMETNSSHPTQWRDQRCSFRHTVFLWTISAQKQPSLIFLRNNTCTNCRREAIN